jgi:regulatory protein
VRPRRAASPAALHPDSPEAAYQAAIKKLARQPQSRAALANKLERQGYAPEAVQAALDQAQADGYLDDRAYAESLVRRRTSSRGYGLIAQELRAKGVEDEAAGPALEMVDREDEASRALQLGRVMLAERPLADRQALQAWVGPRLSRRGFDSGLIYRVCRQLGDEWEASDRFDSVKKRD